MTKKTPDLSGQQACIDHLATILVNNELLTASLIKDYPDELRLKMVRNNQKAAHLLSAQMLQTLGMQPQIAAEPPGGK